MTSFSFSRVICCSQTCVCLTSSKFCLAVIKVCRLHNNSGFPSKGVIVSGPECDTGRIMSCLEDGILSGALSERQRCPAAGTWHPSSALETTHCFSFSPTPIFTCQGEIVSSISRYHWSKEGQIDSETEVINRSKYKLKMEIEYYFTWRKRHTNTHTHTSYSKDICFC